MLFAIMWLNSYLISTICVCMCLHIPVAFQLFQCKHMQVVQMMRVTHRMDGSVEAYMIASMERPYHLTVFDQHMLWQA